MSRLCFLLCLCVAAVGLPTTVRAQQPYGTVRGTVSGSSGAPVGGAHVALLGTAFRAVTDGQGAFEIEDVPAGRYVIQALAAESTIERTVRIGAGSVTRIELFLGPGGIPQGFPSPPANISRDPVSGRLRVPGGLLERLPIDEPRQALTLLPGVVLRGDDVGVGSAASLSVRGSTPGVPSVYVDGAPARFQTLGTQGIAVGANAIEEIGLEPGLADVEVTDARGGVLSYVTRSGGPRFQADFRAGTDEPFGAGSSVGYNRFEGSLGGPVPGVARLTWFAAAVVLGQSSPYLGIGAGDQPSYVLGGADTTVQWTDLSGQATSATLPQFIQYGGRCESGQNLGFDCHGLRRPFDWTTQRTEQGKLRYTYGAGSSISLTGLASDMERRFDPGPAIGDPALYAGARAWSRLAVLNWAQRLPSMGGGALVLKANLSVGSDRQLSGPLDPASETATRTPALGIEFRTLRFTGADSIPFPLTDRIIRNIRSDVGLRVPFLNRTDLRNVQSYRLNPYGLLYGWPTRGVDARLSMLWERRLNGRMELGWRGGRHLVAIGVELEHTEASLYDADLLTEIALDAFRVHPRRLGLFLTDRVTLGKATLELGGRYDRIAPGGAFPNVPGRIFTNPAWSPAAATDDSAYANSVARVFTPGRTQHLLSPRLRLSFELPARSSFRLTIGQAVEPMSWVERFGYTNADLAFASVSGTVFGQDLRPVKSTQLEAAASHRVGKRIALDVAVYHHDHAIPYVVRFVPFDDPANPGRTLNIEAQTPFDAGALGVDARVSWSPSPVVRGAMTYSYVRLSPHGVRWPATQTWSGFAEAAVPASWRPGTVLGAALRGSSLAAIARLTSGVPYTLLVNAGSGILIPGANAQAVEPFNSSRLPWSKVLDLRVARRVAVGGRSASLYADVRNLFGFRNILGGYAETGTTTNDLYRETVLSAEFVNLYNEATVSGALLAGGDVDLRACAGWPIPIDCVALRRVEQRFGDGNGVYTKAEQTRALNAYYDAFFGPWRFLGPGRTLRMGIQWTF